MVSFYDLLGVPSSADTNDIRAAFKRCALIVHPDKGGTKEVFQQVLLAFEALSDPASRQAYDRCLIAQRIKSGHCNSCKKNVNAHEKLAPEATRAPPVKQVQRATSEKHTLQHHRRLRPFGSHNAPELHYSSGAGPARASCFPAKFARKHQYVQQRTCAAFSQAHIDHQHASPALAMHSKTNRISQTETRYQSVMARGDKSSVCNPKQVQVVQGPVAQPQITRSEAVPTTTHVAKGLNAEKQTLLKRERSECDILRNIFFLMRRLPQQRQRHVLANCFDQEKRLMFEAWILKWKEQKEQGSFSIQASSLDTAAREEYGVSAVDMSDASTSDNSSNSGVDSDGSVVVPKQLMLFDQFGQAEIDRLGQVPCIAECPSGIEAAPQMLSIEDVRDRCAHAGFEYAEAWCEDANVPADHLKYHDEDVSLLDLHGEVSHDDSSMLIDKNGSGCSVVEKPASLVEDLTDGQAENQEPTLSNFQVFGMRGIIRNYSGYIAMVSFDNFSISSMYVRDLSKALDFLMVLTEIKNKLRVCNGLSFQDRVRFSVMSILADQGVTCDSMGLRFQVRLEMEWYFGRSIKLPLPRYSDLDSALHAWGQLEPFRSKIRHRPTLRQRWDRLQSFAVEFSEFKKAYLFALPQANDKEVWAKKLDDLQEASEPHRERLLQDFNQKAMAAEEKAQRRMIAEKRQPELQVERFNRLAMQQEEQLQRRFVAHEQQRERWNRHAMACEERRQQQSLRNEQRFTDWNRRKMRAEERYQKKCLKEERRMERLNRRALAKEERDSCQWQRRAASFEERLVQKLCILLRRLDRKIKAGARRRVLEQKQKAASLARANLDTMRNSKREKESRWKRMNRRDMTMEEIMHASKDV